MQRHRVLASITLFVGALSTVSESINIAFFGQPLVHWVTLVDFLIYAALLTGGYLLWTGRKNRYAVSLVGWGLTVLAAVVELGLTFWASAHGSHVLITRVIFQIGYFAGGVLAIGALLKGLQAAEPV